MHVLGSIGHSFSSRRKTSTPKDLHIRKISFSGCSLSSASSASSSSSSPRSLSSSSTLSSSSSNSNSTSASTVRALASAPCSARSRTGSLGFDPLSLHPTFQPPPRLHERPLISPDRVFRHAPPPTPYDDSVDGQSTTDVEDEDEYGEYTVCRAQELRFSHQSETVDAPAADEDDYFLMHLAKKADVPRSRWSDSTIQSLDLDSSDSEASDEDQEDDDDDLEMPNFSRKRCTEPSRPPMRSLDGLDDFMKKGCWKRRGVVFNTGEVRLHSAEF